MTRLTQARTTRRSLFRRGLRAGGAILLGAYGASTLRAKAIDAWAVATAAPAGIAKPLAGQTVRVVMFQHVYARALSDFLPEFTELTGAKVELDILGFDVANQRIDLELSGETGAYDVTNLTFLWSGKWIGAKWSTDLMPLINDPQLTDKSKLDLTDFAEGALRPFQRGPRLYGLPWLADASIFIYRKDIFERHRIAKPPATFDELLSVAQRINSPEVAAFVGRGALNWIWGNFLFAYGGAFFANPPFDFTPVLNSPMAMKATEVFVKLVRDYGVPGFLSFREPDVQTTIGQGKGAMSIDSLGILTAAVDPQRSTVHDKVSFAVPPGGPKGRTPQASAHALMIPVATKDKRKGWEFIKWATSKELQMRIALEKHDAAIPRKSVLGDPRYKSKFRVGETDLGTLQAEVFRLAGAGYMFYRTIPQFGPIGDRVNIYLSEIVTNQREMKTALEAMNQDVAAIMERAGYKIRK